MPGCVLTRLSDGSRLVFDGDGSEEFNPSVTVTEHPVEQGVSVSDHARLDALGFRVDAWMTETPFGRGPGGPDRIDDAKAWLWASAGQPMRVQTSRGGTYEPYILTTWGHTYTVDLSLNFRLTFRQLRIAESQSVRIPPRKPVARAVTGNSSEVDGGKKVLEPPAATPDKSYLLIERNFFGGLLNLGGA